MYLFSKNLIYIALPLACHVSIAGEALVYFQEAMKLIDVHNRKVLEVLDSLPNKYSHAQMIAAYKSISPELAALKKQIAACNVQYKALRKEGELYPTEEMSIHRYNQKCTYDTALRRLSEKRSTSKGTPIQLPFIVSSFSDKQLLHKDTDKRTRELWSQAKAELLGAIDILQSIQNEESAQYISIDFLSKALRYFAYIRLYELYLEEDSEGAANTAELIKKEHPIIIDVLKKELQRLNQVNYYGNEQLAKTLRHPAFTPQL